MAGIAGTTQQGQQERVVQMLDKITYRGRDRAKSIAKDGIVLGSIWPHAQSVPTPLALQGIAVWDGIHPPSPNPESLRYHKESFALAAITPKGLFLARDVLGVKPLYYGRTSDGSLTFASEVKALMEMTRDVHEFPPGVWYTHAVGFNSFAQFDYQCNKEADPDRIAAELRLRIENAISRRVISDETGAWLSGGLDSSLIAALVRPRVRTLHTFVSGVDNAPDVAYARQMAAYLDTQHHELIVTLDDLLKALPETIYHLESFDALLIRSSITNYLTAKMVSEYVDTVFSGEGGDELFAGYDHIKDLPEEAVATELVDILSRLHNTALQRVDRSAHANGIVPFVPFTDLDVVEYAMRIPVRFKLYRQGDKPIEKWILRIAVRDLLPAEVLWRTKTKFWQGTGMDDMLARHANDRISDRDFKLERTLPNGWQLHSKEELMYYRIFREHFGELNNLDWMGRTKGTPTQ
ncbi:MAG: asparagine synthase-related protein [Chloroflexota bacterium]